MLGPFASDIRPMVENFSLASIAFLVNGTIEIIAGLLYAPLVLLALLTGALLAAVVLPMWRRRVITGGRSIDTFAQRFWHVFRIGALFWIWRAFALFGTGQAYSVLDAAILAWLVCRFFAYERRSMHADRPQEAL